MTILFFLMGMALIIIGIFRINRKMIPYHIETVIQGDRLHNWLKINGLINIGWGCMLILLSIATFVIENMYIWIFVLIISFGIKTMANDRNNRKYLS